MSRAVILLATATAATLLGTALVPSVVRPAFGPSADQAPSLVERGWSGTGVVATSIL